MIKILDNFFIIETNNTSYIMSYTQSGLLLHHYYGEKFNYVNLDYLKQQLDNGRGTAVIYEGNNLEFTEYLDLEFSSIGIGDYREHLLSLYSPKLGYTNNFKYESYKIIKNSTVLSTPYSYNEDEVLEIMLFDKVLNVRCTLYYKVFNNSNVISKYMKIDNCSNEKLYIERSFSSQLDMNLEDYQFMTFEGAWAKERQPITKEIISGIYVNDSKTGSSSNKRNPLVILKNKNTTENSGECYGMNLVYSGNHKTIIDATPDNKMRVLMGMSDFASRIELENEFITKEVILTYSNSGLNTLSQNMHDFVNNHIIRGDWKLKEKPVLINNWEATYFNFTESKLLDIAKVAKKLGIEMFVLDDGWFGKRNDDTSSLGDYSINKDKLPKGLNHLVKKITNLGLKFGIWVEPEMVSEKSDLYINHPNWAIQVPNRKPNIARNQLVLDLTNNDVCDYLITNLTNLITSCEISYIKWDYNRNITDIYGLTLLNQGEFFYRYMEGLYKVLNSIKTQFPSLLMEGCASGGARFDLGMLCYFNQIWTSDDTDYLERLYIQTGTSYGYPLSVISNHVSAIPNHQTLRNTPLDSRFNLSCFGVLGYELNLLELTKNEYNKTKKQIELYKQYRSVFQYGKFYRSEKSKLESRYFYNIYKEGAILGFFQGLIHPSQPEDIIYMRGLDDQLYSFTNEQYNLNLKMFGGLINMVSPIKVKINGPLHNFICKIYKVPSEKEDYVIYGDALSKTGIRLKGQFIGTGFNNNVRVLGDFGSRLYFLKKINID